MSDNAEMRVVCGYFQINIRKYVYMHLYASIHTSLLLFLSLSMRLRVGVRIAREGVGGEIYVHTYIYTQGMKPMP